MSLNWRRLAITAGWLALGACSAYDPGLLGTRPDGGTSFEGGMMDAAHDAARDSTTPLPDGSTDTDSGDNDGGNVGPGPCQPGLDSDCVMICPETCDGVDNDCNGMIDDGDAIDLCPLPNAEALCVEQVAGDPSTGACEITNCTGGYADCDRLPATGCEALLNSPEHCGICNFACTYTNASGQCIAETCAFGACLDGFGDCNTDTDDGCETSTNTVDNCGMCGRVCDEIANGSVGCFDGECGVAECGNGFEDCDGDPSNGCETDLSSSVDNCGECENHCMFATATASCSAGFCVPGTCSGGRADCDGMPGNACETDILTDETHCGACGGSCTASQLANTTSAECIGGECSPTACAAGFDDCDGDPDNGCETSLRTTTDCGTCNSACTFAHGVASCSTGTCQLTGCAPLWGDCNSMANDGCERATNTLTDCGTCGTTCTLGGGTASCASGVCSLAGCTDPLADCNGQIGDGCEINTDTSMAHCGGCNSACNATATNGSRTCNNGSCVLTCANGFGNCDGNASNGCETQLNSLSNCGACGMTCSHPNAGASCSSGTCQLGTCNPGFDNCTSAAGCETPINTLANCNGCGDTCSLANATEACVSGTCGITQCDSGFLSCDNNVGNGCETPLNTLANCNGCGTTCNLANATESCATQTCRINQCQGLFANCNNQDSDGCERATNTLTDCGGCGQVCDFVNASESCTSGTCTFGTCATGFGTCDGNNANGCEQALNTTTHCGNCGVGCARTNGSATCASGSCALQQCNAGFATCDSNDGNGCETTLGTMSDCSGCGDACAVDEMCINFQCRGSFPYVPTNFDPSGITHTAQVTLNCGVTTFNSQTQMFTNLCAGQPTPSITVRTQPDTDPNVVEPSVVVLGFDSLTISSGATLKLEGDKPVILAVFGNATISGTINASATDITSGPSGVTCNGNNGTHDADGEDGSSGGGGGGFGTAGGTSGAGNAGAAAAAGGTVAGNAQISPLRGGCRGGNGGGAGSGREAGGAGGAVQLSVGGTLTISATAVIAAAGGGGRKGNDHEDGGGGGGSGGAILIEGNSVSIAAGAWISANGGSGAGGAATNNGNGVNGVNGALNSSAAAAGGNGGDGGNVSCAIIFSGSRSDGGRGGNGAAGGTAAQAGANGTNPSGSCDPDEGGGGGGGGGGAGRIRIRSQISCTIAGNQSPTASTGGFCSLPAAGCVARAHANHGYYFCPTGVGWNTASGLCQMSGMRLARIDNVAENDFITANTTTAEIAIGASDSAVEGAWRWENNNDQLWMGVSDGMPVGGRYANWNAGEPNEYDHGGGIGEDCGYLTMGTGGWNDNNCANATSYVCESQ